MRALLDGIGRWENRAILDRYRAWCRRLGVVPADIDPDAPPFGERGWACAVVQPLIARIEQGDPAAAWIGIELIEEDGGFAFGRILKAGTARALRRTPLSEAQRARIRDRVLAMLERGFLPHEFRQYSRLAARVGLGSLQPRFAILAAADPRPWVRWYAAYLTTGNPGPPPGRSAG